MAKKRSKVGLIISILVLLATIVVVGIIVFNQRDSDISDTSSTNISNNDVEENPDGSEIETPEVPNQPEQPAGSNVDPSQFAMVDVEPLNIRVAYEKTIPGFLFFIKRTDVGTRYVEFTYDKLKGDKCTNDEGLFMTIIENPSTPEDMSTLAKTTVVDGTTYGLTLASDTCTNDKALLQRYQAAFSDGFSLLESM